MAALLGTQASRLSLKRLVLNTGPPRAAAPPRRPGPTLSRIIRNMNLDQAGKTRRNQSTHGGGQKVAPRLGLRARG